MRHIIMKNCDTCANFTKIKTWKDGRKGMCNHTDYNIVNMKGKPCAYYQPIKYNRNKIKQHESL